MFKGVEVLNLKFTYVNGFNFQNLWDEEALNKNNHNICLG
jgi:hypothetical protein